MKDPAGGGRDLRRRLGLVVLAVLIACAVIYLRRQGADLWQHLEFHPSILLPLALAEVGLLVIRGLLTRELCRLFGARLGVVEAASLAAWAGLANYLTPLVGGTSVRALYLKRRYDLPFASFASVQGATYVLHFMVASIVGLASLVMLNGLPTVVVGSLGSALSVVLGICLLLYRRPFSALIGDKPGGDKPVGDKPGAARSGVIGRALDFLRRVLAGWDLIRGADSRRLLLLLLINMLTLASSIALGFALVGMAIGPAQALLIASLFSFSILIAITPASLGISEGVVVFSATALGLHAPTALAAAALRRLTTIAVTAVAAGLGHLVIGEGR